MYPTEGDDVFSAGSGGSCVEREAEVVMVAMGYSTPPALLGVCLRCMR